MEGGDDDGRGVGTYGVCLLMGEKQYQRYCYIVMVMIGYLDGIKRV